MSNISGEGTLNGQIFGITDIIDYDNLTNRPKINNKTVEGEHNGRYYELTESEIIDWIDYAALSEETKKNGKIYYIRNVGTYEEKTISNVGVASFNDGSSNPLVSLKIDIVSDQEGAGTPSPSNPRPINGYTTIGVIVSPTLNPDAGTTTNIALGQTVYGGTLNVITGELTINRALAVYDGSSDEPWTYIPSYGGFRVTITDANIDGIPSEQVISNRFEGSTTRGATDKDIPGKMLAYTSTSDNIFLFFTTALTDLNDWKDWLSNNITQVEYPLSTPLSIHLTPTQIYSLFGNNNIWTYEGSINELKYLSPTGELENQIRTNDEIFGRA